jgi:fumarate hydratase subunit beta
LESDQGLPLGVNLEGAGIYYSGPAEAPEGCPIGVCGPTTAGRMDEYTLLMMKNGALVFMGKGPRSEEVRKACKDYGVVCLSVIGGAAALIAELIKSARVVAYGDLLSEALREIEIKDEGILAVVINDTEGRDLEKELKTGFVPGM